MAGHALAHAWQEQNGPLPASMRLMARKPFVIGGDFSVENLCEVDAVDGMQYRGWLATQLRDVPDGTHVTFHFPG